MMENNNTPNFGEDHDYEIDQTLSELQEELKKLSTEFKEGDDDNELSNLSEKLGFDFEKLIETLTSDENSSIDLQFDNKLRFRL